MNEVSKYEIKRKELLDKIKHLVEIHGFENIKVRLICKELQMSIGNFYHYFPEKNYLARIFFEDMDIYLNDEVLPTFTEDESSNLITYAKAYGNRTVNNGVEACKCINLSPLQSSDVDYYQQERPIFVILHDILCRGKEKGQFTYDMSPLELTEMILVLLRGYNNDWVKRGGNYDIVSRIEKFTICFLKSIT